MGKKEGAKKEEAPVNATNEAAGKDDEEEDRPVIKALKEIDDRYCTARNKLDEEIEKVRKQYAEKQKPLLEERTKLLADATNAEDKESGTPACPKFWFTALSNCSDIAEIISDGDEKPLEYLQDMKALQIDPECSSKGYRIEFHFRENPFFTNNVLWVESHMDYDPATHKPWKEDDCKEIKASKVEWKSGKNVTMAKSKEAAPKKKGKKSTKKATEEPCCSIFRLLFTSVKDDEDEAAMQELQVIFEEMGADDEDENPLEMHMCNVSELLQFLHDDFIPYAVRYYTGEACEDDSDDDEDGEESGDLSESEDDEESEEPAPKKKPGKKSPKTSPQMKPKAAPGGGGEKTEECKQQ